jgi:hypothetical protein
MYRNIYQIEERPVKESDYMTASDVEDRLCALGIAEFVSDFANRADEIAALRSFLESKGVVIFCEDGESFMLTERGKNAYFNEQFGRFMQAYKKLADVTFSEFIENTNIGNTLADLSWAFSDKFGDYILSAEHDISTMDDFMRIAKANQRYFIGGVAGYKY